MKSILKFSLVLLLLQALTIQAALTVTNIAAGGAHSLFLRSNGSLWVMGDNAYGQLGDGTTNNANKPEQIVSSNVITIASGDNHDLFVKSDGSLWAMGDNTYGQLGDGTSNNANKPVQVVTNDVTAIAGGGLHSLFLKSNYSLWGMGYNGFGQLGNGTVNYGDVNLPEQIASDGVVAIAAGWSHTLFLTSYGSLLAMGSDLFGQLGDGGYTSTPISRPEQIVSSGVIAIAAGKYHSLFLTSGGRLWAMGDNAYGQLGDGTTNRAYRPLPEQIVASNVVAIAGGALHSLFLKSDGSLWAMGWNAYGQLGDGTLNNTDRPEQIVSNNVIAIAAGDAHSLFLKSDGSLWAMGDNSTGELGDGFTNVYSAIPEQIVPSPQPVLISSISSGTNLQFNATCQFGGTFDLLTSTNLTQPLNQWTPVWTNFVTARGANNFNATLSNALNSSVGRQFYILQSQ